MGARDGRRRGPRGRRVWLSATGAIVVSSVAAFIVSTAVTLLSPVPRPLPGIGLGSTSLFFIERGVVVFAVLVVALSLLARGLRGELPSQVSTTGLSYPESLERAVSGSDAAITALSARLDRLDGDLDKRDEVLRLLAQQVLELTNQIGGEDGPRPPAGD
jgi:hypothetical protein